MFKQQVDITLFTKSDVQGREKSTMPAHQLKGEINQSTTTTIVADLFEQYHEAIFAYLYRMIDDREVAHDLTQETFLKVFRTRNQLAQIENQRAWIYRIATNLALNTIKRRDRFAWLSWQKVDSSYLSEPDPSHRVGQDLIIEQVLSQLPPNYRAPLLLYSHDGFKVSEVAKTLGLSEGAVKTRLHRARELFRQLYDRANDSR